MTMDTHTAGIARTADRVHATGSGGGGQPDLAHWPLPVGRVEQHHGLTYVHSSRPGGFSADEYKRIPGGGRVELLDGVAVVHPEPGERHQWLVRHFYELLRSTCPTRFEPFIGPMDVPVGRASVFAPDVLVLPVRSGPPAIVVEVREERGADYRRQEKQAKFRGYGKAGVGAYWVVEPRAATVTVYEFGHRRRGVNGTGEVDAARRTREWRGLRAG